ncbi:MAG: DMT family transporter [Actinobacteria bacterium]|nr:DMT family transporter [Actinomycetota bacterium]
MTLALIAITFVWGATFVVVKEAVDRLPVFVFNAWRFAIATVALALVAGPRLRRLGRSGLWHGALLGVALWSGYAFQTFGLQLTTAAKAGFITGMFVVFTPLLQALVVREPPGATASASALLSFLGLGLLSLEGSLVPGLGDGLVLLCAIAFAFHIVGLGLWSHRYDAAALATVQLGVGALLHAVGGIVQDVATTSDHPWLTSDLYVWAAVVFTAVFASAIAFAVQTAAQAVLPPTRAAIILVMEPVFAWATAWLGVPLLIALGITGLEREVFGLREGVGAALILAAMLWAELRSRDPIDLTAAPQTGVISSEQGL